MALPKLKGLYQTHLLKGIGKEVQYRGFTTKEQEKLLECQPIHKMGNESQLTKEERTEIYKAVCAVTASCIMEEIDVRKIPYFDLIDMFIKIRSASAGATVDLRYQVEHEEIEDEREKYEVLNHQVNLADVGVPELTQDKNISIENDQDIEYTVVLNYMSLENILAMENDPNMPISQIVYNLISQIVVDDVVYNKEGKMLVSEEDELGIEDWVESYHTFPLTTLTKFTDFITQQPNVEYTFELESKTVPGKKFPMTLRGLTDFF